MTPQRWQQVEDLFGKSLEIPDVARSAWLDAACTGDPALRRELESLLAAHEPGELSVAAAIGEATALWAASGVDRRIGPWRITGVLGEGRNGRCLLSRSRRRRIPAHRRPEARQNRRVGGDAGAIPA